MTGELMMEERNELLQHEQVIEQGLKTFVDVGNALLSIRDKKLYRQDFGTFEDYCNDRWGFNDRHARRLIDSAEVMNNLKSGPIGPLLPATESQARPLTKLSPDIQPFAWQYATETAPNGKVTAAHVEQSARIVSDAIDTISKALGDEARTAVLSGNSKVTKQDVTDAAKWYKSNPGGRPTIEQQAEELAGGDSAYNWTEDEKPEAPILVANTEKEIVKAARLIQKQRSEEKRQEKEAKKQAVLAKYDDVPQWEGELKVNTISLGNICNLQLPSESVDMVFTDPPYHDEYIDLYEQLARVANVALKPGGYLMTYAGKMFIPEIIKHLSAKLEYVSIYAVFQPFSQARIVKHNIFENWRPILVFKKPGKTEVKEWAQDVVRGTRDKSHHEWQQDSEAPLQYIAAYTKPGDIVLDPFVGGGTTPWSCRQLGRYYVCFDANEDAVKLSMERLANG